MSSAVLVELITGGIGILTGGVGSLWAYAARQGAADASRADFQADVLDRLDGADRRAEQHGELLQTTVTQVAVIKAQFSPNGGSSLADRIGRMERKVAEITGLLRGQQK